MPIIKTNLDLINNYNEISKICNKNKKTVYITKDGEKDLVAMSIEEYKKLMRIIEKCDEN